MQNYDFTNNWFDVTARGLWDTLLPAIQPKNILEVGSYEGASTCYLINKIGQIHDLEIHCIDTWQGGIEHSGVDMAAIEQRFYKNISLATRSVPHGVRLVSHRGASDEMMIGLLSDGKRGFFDFIYIDGSHQAPDVLADAVLGFRLLKVGGVIAFDDYTWKEGLPYGTDPVRCPKWAIDAFTNIYCRKVELMSSWNSQVFTRKTAE